MANPYYTFEHKNFYVDNPFIIKKKDLVYEEVNWDMEAIPVPVKAKPIEEKIAVGYRALKVDVNNKETHGIVTYVSAYGRDYIVKITWDDGYIDHNYLSKLVEQFAIWKS